MTDTLDDYDQALRRQLEAKRKMVQADREYEQTKHKVYLSLGDITHYKALALANTDPKVMKAKKASDDARLEHYECWIESHILNRSLGALSEGDDSFRTNNPSND